MLLRLTEGDVDGDGDIDMIAMGDDPDGIRMAVLYENTGGTFVRRATFPTDLGTFANIADLNGDGLGDIAMGMVRGASWYENTGNWGFGAEQSIMTCVECGAKLTFRPTDLDQDGDLDILSSRMLGGDWNAPLPAEIRFFDNNGGFGAITVEARSDLDLGDAHAADLDGDGDLDLAVTTLAPLPSLKWHENTGETYGPGVAGSVSWSPYGYIDPLVLDTDGDLDLLALGTDELVWYKNLGGGTFDVVEQIDNTWSLFSTPDFDGLPDPCSHRCTRRYEGS